MTAPRNVRSHGSSQNGIPLRVGEPTLGDHLKEIRVRTVLAGKTRMVADEEGMERLGIAPEVARLRDVLFRWYRSARNRITVSDGWIASDDETALAYDPLLAPGILIGYWDEAELEEEKRKRAAFAAQSGVA